MPPQTNRRRTYNRARPISSSDNPSTTGLLVNPNGSYVANNTPQTNAYAGAQGAFGATLPRVQYAQPRGGRGIVTNQTPYQQVENYNVAAQFSNLFPSIANALQSYGPRRATTPQMNLPNLSTQTYPRPPINAPQSTFSSQAAMPQQLQGQYRTPNLYPTGSGYWGSEKGVTPPNVFGYGMAGMENVLARVQAGETQNLSKQDMEVIDQYLETGQMPGSGTVTTPIGTGSAEFMNTEFMQKNVEKNVGFYDQLRWDPQRGKYVQIGKLMQEGKLRPDGSWNPRGNPKRKKVTKKAREFNAALEAAEPEKAALPGGYGVVSFNAGLG